MVTCSPFSGGYLLSNGAGIFHVEQSGGFVSSWKRDEKYLSLVTTTKFESGNDPKCGALFLPAWHHYRDIPEDDIWNRGWELNPLRAGMYGVSRSRTFQKPKTDTMGRIWLGIESDYYDRFGYVMRVQHLYLARKAALSCWITFEQRARTAGPRAFIKEPKITMAFRTPFEFADVRDGHDKQLTFHDLRRITDPAKHTEQLRSPDRRVVRLIRPDKKQVRVTAMSAIGARGRLYPWMSTYGLNAWTQASDGRRPFEDPTKDGKYCRQGPGSTLTRNWEIAKSGHDISSLMLHAWEGGSGLPDCLGCAREYGPPGESYTAYVSLTATN